MQAAWKATFEAFARFSATRALSMVAGVAAITGSFEGTVVITDKQPPVSYRLIVEARGRSGFVKGESMMKLAEHPDGVAVEVAATAHVGGLIAQVGQRLLGATAKMMMDRFFRCMLQKTPRETS